MKQFDYWKTSWLSDRFVALNWFNPVYFAEMGEA